MPTTKRRTGRGITAAEGILINARSSRKYAIAAMKYADPEAGGSSELHRSLAEIVDGLDGVIATASELDR